MPAVIPIAMMVVAAASAVYSGVTAQNTARAEEAQQGLNNKATMESAIASYGDLTPKERDIDTEATNGGIKAQADYLRSVGNMNLLSGASGTYGGSVDSMLRDLKTTRGRNLSDVVSNRTTELDNVKAQAEQIRYGARANMQTRIFSKPSALGIGLSAVSSGAQGFSSGTSIANSLKDGETAQPNTRIKGGS